MIKPYDDRDGVIWFDGKLLPWRSANVHFLTHALHYASSVFEGERAYGGRIFESRRHTERLLESARQLEIDVAYTAEEIEAAKQEAMSANGLTDAYVRPLIWRGSGTDMGVAALENRSHLAIATWEWGAYYGNAKSEGARLDISDWRRPSPETAPVHVKAAGLYMICTMSKHRAQARGYSDSMMLDYRGYVAEATGANIFFVKGDTVHTPLPDCFLNGITRQIVIGLLKAKGVEVIERHVLPEELSEFEQCWLTGSAAEVTPVSGIGDIGFGIGELTQSIARDYEALVRA